MSLDQIRPYLHDAAAIVRVNAIEAMAAQSQSNEEVLLELLEVIVEPANSIRLMGTISVAHVGIASILRCSCEAAKQAVKRLVSDWPEPDRDDLLWYLESVGVEQTE